MARVVISDSNLHQLFEVQYAANVKWRKALTSIGYASFDIPLNSAYADPRWIRAGCYVHIFNDTADSTSFTNADWGGVLENDYEIKPKEGVLTVAAAGMAQVLNVSIVNTTTVYTNIDLGSVVSSLVATRDNNLAITLTPYTVSAQGPVVGNYTAGYGDVVWSDLNTLMQNYSCDFEVRPDLSYAFYTRQGQDRPDLAIRYGDKGNVSLETQMHLVNTEMANVIYYSNNSTSIVVANPTSYQYYGKKSMSFSDGGTFADLDLATKAQVELAYRDHPLFVIDKAQIVDTPLLPFNQVRLGDRIMFESDIPFLQSFAGLQRILAIDYDDTKRTMDLTLGNAVYVVRRQVLHSLRLYASAQ